MIESWVGEVPFQKAVNAYINRFKYGNAKAEDFWGTVAASTSKPVDRVMQTFVDRPGLPLIGMSASMSGRAHDDHALAVPLFGGRFTDPSSSSPVWNMPVCLHTDSGRTTCELLEQPRTTVTLDGCKAWTMPNAGGRGYYRASLDPAALKALEGNIPKLPGPERLTLLADEWALVRARLHDVGSYLDLASAYGSEETGQVLESLTEALQAIDQQLTTPASRPAFRAWVRRLLGPSAAKVGWDGKNGRSDDNARARSRGAAASTW